MLKITGEGVSAGIAAAPLYFLKKPQICVNTARSAGAEAEWAAFQDAQQRAIEELGVLAEKVRTETGEEAALLFETYQMMLEDDDLTDGIRSRIEAGSSASAAVSETAEELAAGFLAMEDEYFSARAADLRDLANRLNAQLTGADSLQITSEIPVILAADDLSPSETVQLERSKIAGFLLRGGSAQGHTAILARTAGIPAVIGLGDSLPASAAGEEVLMDGETGTVLIGADSAERAEMLQKAEQQRQRRAELEAMRGLPNETADGRRIELCCNIAEPDEVRDVLANEGEGIGLMRSEFLYLGASDYPDEETQFAAYKKVLSAMKEKRVVIRTLDIGADKRIAYFDLPDEENPALGTRALRLCLLRPELFRTQLRALYRASVFGKLGIMFPMVTSVWEVQAAKELCAQVQEELRQEGIPFSDAVEIGIMIETPAAALISDLLAREVDFFSIGTNDLTQYVLACDRGAAGLGKFCDPQHPALQRAIRMVCENAHAAGIRVCVCGEAAADPAMTSFLLSAGVDGLSVSPRAVLSVRRSVRSVSVKA